MELDVPDSSTLFRPIQTQVYYCQDHNKKFDETVLEYLQEMSAKIAKQKNLIVQPSWHYFFDQVFCNITKHDMLQEALFDSEIVFFEEDVPYTEINNPSKRSNIIRMYLHEILTHAIFNYSLCQESLWNSHKKHIPKIENREKCTNIW